MARVLGIAGRATCGKDTLADAVQSFINDFGQETVTKYNFALPIKQIVGALFGWDDRHAYGELKETPVTVVVTKTDIEDCNQVIREIMGEQFPEFLADTLVSTLASKADQFGIDYDVYREQHEDYMYSFVISPRRAYQVTGTEYGRTIDHDIWLKLAPTENVIIPDVRFENEANFIRAIGGTVLHLVRPEIGGGVVEEHDSEKGIAVHREDYTLINDKSQHALIYKAMNVANMIRKVL